MKESYRKGVANRPDPESCVASRKAAIEALTGAHAGSVLSLEKFVWDADAVIMCGRQYRQQRNRELLGRPTWSETICMHGNLMRGKREIPRSTVAGNCGPHRETANGVRR